MNSSNVVQASILLAKLTTLQQTVAAIDSGAAIVAMALRPKESTEAITVPTEGLVYPPQMIQSIRSQEIEQWQKAYDELVALGADDVPKPPGR